MSRPKILYAHRIGWGTVSLALLVASSNAVRAQDSDPANGPEQAPPAVESEAAPATPEQPPRPPRPPQGPAFLFQRGPDGRAQLIMPHHPPTPVPPDISWDDINPNALANQPHEERYMIGVVLESIQTGLHQRLGIAEGQGLLVTRLDEKFPASQAGLEQYDIILQVNGEYVSQPQHVATKVKESAGAPLTFSLLRDGTSVDVEIVPVKHLAPAGTQGRTPFGIPMDWERFLSQIKERDQEMQLIGPGVVMPQSSQAATPDVEDLEQKVEALSRQQEELADKLEKLIEMLGNEGSTD